MRFVYVAMIRYSDDSSCVDRVFEQEQDAEEYCSQFNVNEDNHGECYIETTMMF